MTIMGITLSAAVVWLIVAAVLAIIEALTMGLSTIWFAGGAAAAAIAAMLGCPFIAQFIIFLVVSILLLYFTRPLVKDKLKVGTTKTNADALVGKTATVTSDITATVPGQVKVSGMEWSAVSEDAEPVAAGTSVIIKGIEGVKLIVSRS
jgi:membrane protein implicated in regulation of membrane protease activity